MALTNRLVSSGPGHDNIPACGCFLLYVTYTLLPHLDMKVREEEENEGAYLPCCFHVKFGPHRTIPIYDTIS